MKEWPAQFACHLFARGHIVSGNANRRTDAMEENPVAPQVTTADAPLKDMDEWDDFLTGRYQEGKSEDEFRLYDEKATPGVAEFYRLNHQYQTYDYVMAKEKEYFGLNKGEKSIWEAAEFLNTLVDDS